MAYAYKLAAVYELRTNVEGEIVEISADLCLKSVEYWVQHLDLQRMQASFYRYVSFTPLRR